MAGRKTRDGIKISLVERALESIPGISIRDGTRHRVASMEGQRRLCPIATSTDARRMVVPWLKEVTGVEDASEWYQFLRTGGTYSVSSV